MILRALLCCLLCVLSAPTLASEKQGSFPLAINLSPVNDWSAQQPFLNVMKSARRWIGHKPGQWGGVTFEELEGRGVLDAQGWPTQIPNDVSSIGTLLLTDLPPEAEAYAGRYTLQFEGSGIVEVSGSVKNVRYGDGSVSFDFSPGGTVLLKIQRSDPGKSGDYVRNIAVVKDAHRAAWEAGDIFNPIWLQHLDGFETLRFMNWTQTNNSTDASWADRAQISDFSYGRKGVPVEIMVRLANTLGADPWFNMPHLADQDYSRGFATLVKEQLNDQHRAYVEYSNEVWNWQFEQTAWAHEAGLARWNKENRGQDFYGMRSAEVAKIWTEVFKDERDRLINVIATQTGWLGLEQNMLHAPLWVAEDPAQNKPPYSYMDAYAITGYFGYSMGTPERQDMVRQWIIDSWAQAEADADAKSLVGEAREDYVLRHAYDAATVWATHELFNGGRTGQREGSLRDLVKRILPYHADVAKTHGLDLIMYEGGSHVTGVGEVANDEALTAFFTHLNYTAEMGSLYANLITGWSNLTDAPFTLYTDVLVPTKWGSWGHLRYLGDTNPRWEAIQDLKAQRVQ